MKLLRTLLRWIFRILLWGIKTAGCIALFVAYLLAMFWLCDAGG